MLPELFLDRLKRIISEEKYASVSETFHQDKLLSVRVNTLKISVDDALRCFAERNISVEKTPLRNPSFLIRGVDPQEFSRFDFVCEGKIYMQSLSSMLPVIVLDPQPGDDALDLCAAPGSKTSQMAAQMQNQGNIVAIDSVRPRFYRLKSVLNLQGVGNVQAKCLDGSRYRSGEVLFDRILVDAPCSSESRFKSFNKKTVGYWSLRKIKEMVHKQRGLLLNACRMLKPGGVLVYSTCTFAPEENEGVVDWVLRKLPGEIQTEPISLDYVKRYPAILEWEKRIYNSQVAHCFRVLPTDLMEGFFMAKIVRGNG
jgi:16S rRNA (cytosine1407-C5)-methyltransferase